VRVIVTRPRDRAAPLADALRREGFDVEICPLTELVPIGPERIDVSGYDWVVVTSAFGAEQLAARHEGELPRVAAVGPATAHALRQRAVVAEFVPRAASQEGLVAEFPRPAGRVLFVGAAGARDLLQQKLGAEFCAVYETRQLRPKPLPTGDLVALASGSAARAWSELRIDLPAISIGPQTTSVAAAAGIEVVSEAQTPDVEGLVDCAAAWRASSRSSPTSG
jgi:uroporphyrinogen-III synthase